MKNHTLILLNLFFTLNIGENIHEIAKEFAYRINKEKLSEHKSKEQRDSTKERMEIKRMEIK